MPGAWHATQLNAAAVLKTRARADHQVTHGAVDEDFAGAGLAEDPRPTNPNALSQASTEKLLLELRRRIVAPRDRRRETWDDGDGLDSRGDWPDEG